MRGKIAFVVGAAVGYVLGSRAGRERYEQIKRGANHLWNTEPVQNGVSAVRGAVDERADDLKAFAIRVGSDVFSNLAQSGKKSDPFSTTGDAADDAGESSATSAKSSGGTAKSSGSKSTSAKRKSTGSQARSGANKSGGSKAGS